MRQELARHLHHQVTDISQQLDTILCGKQRRMATGALHISHEKEHPTTDHRCCESILPYVVEAVVESVDGGLHSGVDGASALLLRQLKQATLLKLHDSKNLAAWQSVLRAYLEQQLSWTKLP